MENQTQQIAASPEILCAMLGHKIKETENENIKSEIETYLYSQYNIKTDLANKSIKIVQNKENEINLSLPYYEKVEECSRKAKLRDKDMEDVEGAEIIGTVGVILASAILGTGVVAGGLAIGVSKAQSSK